MILFFSTKLKNTSTNSLIKTRKDEKLTLKTYIKQLGCLASLNQIIYITADLPPVGVDHAAHAVGCVGT